MKLSIAFSKVIADFSALREEVADALPHTGISAGHQLGSLFYVANCGQDFFPPVQTGLPSLEKSPFGGSSSSSNENRSSPSFVAISLAYMINTMLPLLGCWPGQLRLQLPPSHEPFLQLAARLSICPCLLASYENQRSLPLVAACKEKVVPSAGRRKAGAKKNLKAEQCPRMKTESEKWKS